MNTECVRSLCVRATTIPSLEAETALHVLMDHFVQEGRLMSHMGGRVDILRSRMLALTFVYAWEILTGTRIYRVPKKHRRLPLRYRHGQIVGLGWVDDAL